MKFGVDKCAFVQIEKGKLIQIPEPLIINDLIIKPLPTGNTYTYLEIEENIAYDGPMNKVRITKEYLHRVKKIWSSELSDLSEFSDVSRSNGGCGIKQIRALYESRIIAVCQHLLRNNNRSKFNRIYC